MLSKIIKLQLLGAAALCAALVSAGCGSGSGGDVFTGAAELNLMLDTGKIDSGEFLGAEVALGSVSQRGILLKLRYPKVLKYVERSAFLTPGSDSEAFHFEPGVEDIGATDTFLVFFVDQSDLQGDDGTLRIQLKALSPLAMGSIEVDADENDPSIPDSREFDADSPLFSAQDSANIEISGTAEATPTAGTGSGTS